MPPLLTPIGNEWNPPAAAFGGPAAPVIGWLEPATQSDGVADHDNSGTFDSYGTPTLHAGVVNYVEGDTVEWSLEWSPVAGDTPIADSPVYTYPPPSFDLVLRADLVAIASGYTMRGSGILTAIVNGVAVPVGERLVLAMTEGQGGYPAIAWGPEP